MWINYSKNWLSVEIIGSVEWWNYPFHGPYCRHSFFSCVSHIPGPVGSIIYADLYGSIKIKGSVKEKVTCVVQIFSFITWKGVGPDWIRLHGIWSVFRINTGNLIFIIPGTSALIVQSHDDRGVSSLTTNGTTCWSMPPYVLDSSLLISVQSLTKFCDLQTELIYS